MRGYEKVRSRAPFCQAGRQRAEVLPTLAAPSLVLARVSKAPTACLWYSSHPRLPALQQASDTVPVALRASLQVMDHDSLTAEDSLMPMDHLFRALACNELVQDYRRVDSRPRARCFCACACGRPEGPSA